MLLVNDSKLLRNGSAEEEVGVDGGGIGLGLVASLLSLLICLSSNVQCIRTIRRGKLRIINGLHHASANNVIDLVTVICVVSLINGTSICLSQILTFILGKWTLGHHVCKAHGFFTNLMSFLVIWYTTLLGLERHFKFVNPAEHTMTFSRINVRLIVFGIAFVILSVVAGPIYGWGDYIYVHAIRTCTFDVKTKNALTYYIMTSIVYLMFPYVIMAGCCVTISFSSVDKLLQRGPSLDNPASSSTTTTSSSGFDEQHCDRYLSKKFIWPYALSVTLSLLLQLPTHVTSVAQLIHPEWISSTCLLFTAFWLHIFAINSCLSSSILVCNIRYESCFNGGGGAGDAEDVGLVTCSPNCPWWKLPVATECPLTHQQQLNGLNESKRKKRKNASHTCKLCLQLHIIHGP